MAIHPIHDEYVKTVGRNSVKCLLNLLDSLQPTKRRHECVMEVAMTILKPRLRAPVSLHETFSDRMEEHVSYNRFKDGVMRLASTIPERLLVGGIVHQVLGFICTYAFSDADEVIQKRRSLIDFTKQQILSSTDDREKESLEAMVENLESGLRSVHDHIGEWREFYETFCTHVLFGLLRENEEVSRLGVESLRRDFADLSDEEFPGAPREE